MKNLTFVLLVIFAFQLKAENTDTVPSTIKDVVVYLQGAQITRNCNVHLQAGKNILYFTGLSSKLLPGNIEVSSKEDITILAVSHNISYLNEKQYGIQIDKIINEKSLLLEKIETNQKMLGVYDQEKNMIITNKSIGGTTQGVNILELKNGSAFFRDKLTEIELKILELQRENKKLETNITNLNNQLQEMNYKKEVKTSTIKVEINSKQEQNIDLNIRYIINDAGWKPAYDLRIKTIEKPLSLTYKASVFQNTDEDWNNVKLTLSSGNPQLSASKPLLGPYNLYFNNYPTVKKFEKQNYYPGKGELRGKVIDASTLEPLPFADVVVFQNGSRKGGASTDLNGNYIIKPISPGTYDIIVNYVGYKDFQIKDFEIYDNRISFQNINMIQGQSSNGVLSKEEIKKAPTRSIGDLNNNITVYKKPMYEYDAAPIKEEKQIPYTLQATPTTTEFKIDIPYTIPSDYKDYAVNITQYEVPSIYKYFCVPKLATYAYLVSYISDWSKYNLLNGEMSLYLGDTYRGKSSLDAETFKDTLEISVGIDNDVNVQRKIQKEFVKREFLSSYIRESRAWEINIRNNKPTAIEITIEDNYPVSQNSNIKVELIESSGATIDEETGKLVWKLKIDPSQSKKLLIKYSVRYPSDEKLYVE
jgi:hypothetical protein